MEKPLLNKSLRELLENYEHSAESSMRILYKDKGNEVKLRDWLKTGCKRKGSLARGGGGGGSRHNAKRVQGVRIS